VNPKTKPYVVSAARGSR